MTHVSVALCKKLFARRQILLRKFSSNVCFSISCDIVKIGSDENQRADGVTRVIKQWRGMAGILVDTEVGKGHRVQR